MLMIFIFVPREEDQIREPLKFQAVITADSTCRTAGTHEASRRLDTLTLGSLLTNVDCECTYITRGWITR